MYWCWSGFFFPNWSSTVADGMKHLFRYLWCARMLIQLENPVKCGNIMHFSTVRFFGGQIIYLEATFFKLKIRVVNEGIFSCFVWMKCQWIIELSETGRKLHIDWRTLPYHWKSAKYRHANRRSGRYVDPILVQQNWFRAFYWVPSVYLLTRGNITWSDTSDRKTSDIRRPENVRQNSQDRKTADTNTVNKNIDTYLLCSLYSAI